MRKRKWMLMSIIIIGIAGIAYWSLRSGVQPIRVLETAEVRRGNIRKVLEATGIVQAQVGAIVKIGARATGSIDEMRVKVGDPVQKGEVIALIDDREQLAQLDVSKARLESAKAEQGRVETVYPKRIAEAEAQLRLAEAEEEYARLTLKRQAQLYAKKLVAKDVYDAASRDALVKASQVSARRASAELLKTEFEKERIKAKRNVDEARATLSTRNTQLSYTRIVSPIEGVVSQVTIQEGETVVAGLQVANLITVIDPTKLEMWIYVDETDVGQVKPGQAVEFQVDAYPDTVFQGAVELIYPQPEIRDNIVYYKALVPVSIEQAERLRPEMTTQCRIVVQQLDDVLVIPNTALKWVQGTQVVYGVNNDGSVVQLHPELGLAGLRETEVVSGLEEGQTVAVQVVLPAKQGKK
ncbi:efflux RND transporter periplasmic adaptor subunit [Desulfovibrio inopinatus]|uniref:efflux RND transporter periplasmic adaptor subunit n=1 Tax=Desulfovibrio inopinatus TaxID=102109 RepID=UPI00041C29A4|nr:efflux RND transporter periplasmic adaptor subunit [Desulfovibrio inopinatus]